MPSRNQGGIRRKGDLCRGNHHHHTHAHAHAHAHHHHHPRPGLVCLLAACWLPVGCLLDGWTYETTPTVALTAIHATVVLPLSPSLPLSTDVAPSAFRRLPTSLSPSFFAEERRPKKGEKGPKSTFFYLFFFFDLAAWRLKASNARQFNSKRPQFFPHFFLSFFPQRQTTKPFIVLSSPKKRERHRENA